MEIENDADDCRKRKYCYNNDFQLNNEFIDYYKNIIEPSEWDVFCETLKRELPISFRLSRINTFHNEIKPLIKLFEDSFAGIILKLAWFDEAYEIKMNKKSLKNNKFYDSFRKFLVNATELALLNRQEAVSMIPPLFLDVQPHHKVLDMCAAPGSKTTQLIEMIHQNGLYSKDNVIDIPCGFVIANDNDKSRCYTLIHQLKRIPSPNLIVTSHDSTIFPDFYENKYSTKKVLFDRILCDVPCSGDGTIRKNINANKFWKTSVGQGMHKLQCKILKRGIELLSSNGGRLVYSTCSMNPIENEAVVIYALRTFSGNIKLIDTSDMLPNLIKRPGIIPAFLDNPLSEFEIKNFNIQFCTRIYPHLQDTGGFFIACFEKYNTESPATNQIEKQQITSYSSNIDSNKQIPCPPKGSIVIKRISTNNDKQMIQLFDFYGINSISADLAAVQLSEKSEEKNIIYFINHSLLDLIETNLNKLKILHCGVRGIVKSRLKSMNNEQNDFSICDYRIVNEALYLMKDAITKRVINIDPDIFGEIIAYNEIEKCQLCDIKSNSNDFAIRANTFLDQLNCISNGSFILNTEVTIPYNNQKRVILAAAFHSKKMIRILVKKDIRIHYLMVLGKDINEAEMIINKKLNT